MDHQERLQKQQENKQSVVVTTTATADDKPEKYYDTLADMENGNLHKKIKISNLDDLLDLFKYDKSKLVNPKNADI